MTRGRDELYAVAERALLRYQDSGDLRFLFDREAFAAVRELAAMIVEPVEGGVLFDFPAAKLAAYFHWARFVDGRDASAELEAIDLFRMIDEYEPDRLEPHARRTLGWDVAPDSPRDAAHSALRYVMARRERAMLDQAVELFERSVDEAADDDPELYVELCNFAVALADRARLDRNSDELRRAVQVGLKGVALTPQEVMGPFVLTNVVDAIVELARDFDDWEHVNMAVQLARWALTVAVEQDDEVAKSYSHLGSALRMRAKATGSAADLDDAVGAFATAAELSPPEDQHSMFRVTNFAETLGERAGRIGSREDLDAAVATQQAVVSRLPTGHVQYNYALTVLVSLLQQRFELTGAATDLDEADAVLSRALNLSESGVDRARHAINLSVNASVRAERDRSRPSLDRAVELAWAALSAVVPGGRGWAIALRNLEAPVNARISAFGEDAGLDDAVDVLREAVNHSGDPVLLDSLGVLLSARFRLRGDAEDLDRAVQVNRRAVDGTPLDSPERAGYLINLATSMAVRAARSRDDSALAEAVERGIEAVDAAGAHRPRIAGIFAQVLVKSYQATGATQLLAEGVGRLRGVATLTRPGTAAYRTCRSALSGLLHERFVRLGSRADLNDALTAAREAADASSVDHAGELEVVNNFAEVLRAWYDAHGDRDNLDEAVAVGRRVARHVSPDDRNRPMYLANLCRSLRTRYDVAWDEVDLRESLEFGREASASGNDAGVLSTLGATLGMLYRHTGSTEYLDEAVDVGRRAVAATTDGDSRKAVRLVNIASSLRARGTAADLAEAAGHLRGSAAWPTGAVEIRVLAAIRLGDQSAEAGDAGLAMEGFGSAVRVLPLLAWRGLDHADKEERLAEQVGLADASASWALNAGHPDQAVELLDQGRSVLWTQLLDQRAEPDALAAVAPELHRRFHEVRESLDLADPGAERP